MREAPRLGHDLLYAVMPKKDLEGHRKGLSLEELLNHSFTGLMDVSASLFFLLHRFIIDLTFFLFLGGHRFQTALGVCHLAKRE